MRDVAVREDDLIDGLLAADRVERGLRLDRDAIAVERTGQHWRVTAVADAWNLRPREGDHLGAGIVAVDDVEVVEVAAGRANDDNAPWRPSAAPSR